MAWAIAKHNGSVLKDNDSRLLIYDSYKIADLELNKLRSISTLKTNHLTIIDVNVVKVKVLNTIYIDE